MQIKDYFQRKGLNRLLILVFIVLILIVIRDILNLVLITFIFAFLMDRIQSGITRLISKWVKIKPQIIIIFLYAMVIALLTIGISKYFPIVVGEISQLIKQLSNLNIKPQATDNEMINYVVEAINRLDLASYLEDGFDILSKSVTNIGKWGLQIFLAVVLSLFFLLEKKRIIGFTRKFKTSKISFLYNELEYFGDRFLSSFGKVIEVQFLIALINCVLSVILLSIMGFPQLIALGLMIFLLGLIPVAGVFISLIPLSIIGFSIGGIRMVIYVLIAVAVIHALESYVLNPKLMSSKTHLPVFYTFIVLIFGEHYFGVWGLILGIPLFIFVLDLLDVDPEEKESPIPSITA
ncbi:MAG: AI-2E family transporter [Gorillibacterium sp.]|nr:AI-2E family transporter [Gorillibacterium sp.]